MTAIATTVHPLDTAARSRPRAPVVGKLRLLLVACGLFFSVSTPSQSQAPGEAAGSANDGTAAAVEAAPPGIAHGTAADPGALADQASNPAAPLTQIQIRDVVLPNLPGTDGATNLLQIQPVVPIGPFTSLPFLQLIKITLEAPSLPGPVNDSGFGDVSLVDLVSIKTSWGRLGFGPTVVFPTASSEELGAGKWQAGPAVALIYTGTKNLTAGAVLQNPISFAGDSDRLDVNQLVIAPTLTINLTKGWFGGLSDFNWTFDWEDGGAATIPLGVQVGKIVRIGRQPVSMSVEAGRTMVRPDDTPDPGWIFGFEFTPIFNWHVGPRQKIKLRGKTSG
jgi:hypothetical protein